MHAYAVCRNLSFGIMGLVSGVSSAALAAVNAMAAPVSTPSGITLVDVTSASASAGGGGGGVTTEWYYSRLGDSDGKPLYTYDKDGMAGKSTCVAECAKEFPPYRVAKGAVPFGAWSIVARADGTRQWAYQGRPLYRYSGVDPVPKAPVTTTGYAAADARRAVLQDVMKLDGKSNSPKEGWRRAALSTDVGDMPPEFDLKSISTANGYAFIVPATGHILYVFKTAPKDPANWTPAYAAALEKNAGDFSVVVRPDGKRQWAYRHQPLYTYNDDSLPDDINGLTAQSDAQIALALRNYMPAGLAITVLPFRGPIMVTAQGKTVYVQARYHNQFGGLENRGGFQYSYSDAKGVGTQACVDDCLKKWQPVVAPAKAQPSGMWEIYTRPDGTRQWAYKGAALYTYAADKSPGDNEGNNIHEIVFGNGHNEDRVKMAGGDVRSVAGSGFYWHVVPFFN
jgi:predicted lipoprotein with Yx(FWY)xxD motif